MKSLFELTSGEITNRSVYYFKDGRRLTLEINDVDDKEMRTPFGYLIKVVEFTKDGIPVCHRVINRDNSVDYVKEIYFMRLRDIEDEYDIWIDHIGCITHA